MTATRLNRGGGGRWEVGGGRLGLGAGAGGSHASAPDGTPFAATRVQLILRTLEAGPRHGWDISDRIQQISQDVLTVGQGSLYPALHRVERQGWIRAEWGISELGRRARFYTLTAAGKKQLALETADWERLSAAIARVLRMA
jgi:PadR family transcriptional regulator